MDKRGLSERDICTKFITPALRNAGWDEMLQIREEVSFTKGRIIVRGKLVTRGQGKRADYILYYLPNIPIALIEAKDNTHSVGDGMQQALIYPYKLIRVRVDPRKALPEYLKLAGESDGVCGAIEEICATTVGNWGISASNLKQVRFPLPPLAEQLRIVAKIDELMALCDRLEASLATADQTRRRLLEALLHEALEPQVAREPELA